MKIDKFTAAEETGIPDFAALAAALSVQASATATARAQAALDGTLPSGLAGVFGGAAPGASFAPLPAPKEGKDGVHPRPSAPGQPSKLARSDRSTHQADGREADRQGRT